MTTVDNHELEKSFVALITKAINKSIKEESERIIDEAIEQIRGQIRKKVAEIILKISDYYDFEFCNHRIVIQIDTKKLNDL